MKIWKLRGFIGIHTTPAVRCFNWVWLDKSVKFGTQVAHGIYFQLMHFTHWYLNGNNLKYWFEFSDVFSPLKRSLGHRAVSNLKRRVRQGSLPSCVRVLSSHNSIQHNWNRATFDFFFNFDILKIIAYHINVFHIMEYTNQISI